jgi:hypothetical protein
VDVDVAVSTAIKAPFFQGTPRRVIHGANYIH